MLFELLSKVTLNTNKECVAVFSAIEMNVYMYEPEAKTLT